MFHSCRVLINRMWTCLLSPLLILLFWTGGSEGYQDDDSESSGEESECEVGEWSKWSPCVRSPACPRNKGKQVSHSHSMHATRGYDQGRKGMMRNVRTKTQVWKQRESCTSEHSCPQNDQHKSIRGHLPCDNGLSDIYPCRNIDLLSYLNMEDLTGGIKLKAWGTPNGNDIWGWTDPQTRDEYAIIGTTHGTSFVRITDPENPLVLGFLQTRTYRSIWRDIKVVNDFAFIGSEAWNHGMQVFDLSRLRNMDKFSELKSDLDYLELGNTHNVVGNNETGFIYLVGDRQRSFEHKCRGGLHMIDVKDPLKPTFVGCYDDDGYSHDAQCVIYRGPDRKYQGKEICFNYNEDSLTIVDVTDKTYPKIVSKLGYDGSQYTHQGWLTPDHQFILMNDELDEYYAKDQTKKYTRTLVWDVKKLMQPKLVQEFWSHLQSIDHNLYTRGNLTYMTNYKSGLRIVHFDEKNMALKEVGYFDVFPSVNDATFGGSWSNYPYYDSGVVAISSIEYGLYIVKPDTVAIEKAVQSTKPYGEETRSRGIIAAKIGDKCPHPMETRQCVPEDC